MQQRQDSVSAQLRTLAEQAEQAGLRSVVTWLREGGPVPPREDVWRARKLAVAQGCYDADDWLGRSSASDA